MAVRGCVALPTDSVIDLDYVDSIYIRDGDRIEPLGVQPVPPEYLSTLGVLPSSFFRPPDALMVTRPVDAGSRAFTPIARLADGVSPDEAQAPALRDPRHRSVAG